MADDQTREKELQTGEIEVHGAGEAQGEEGEGVTDPADAQGIQDSDRNPSKDGQENAHGSESELPDHIKKIVKIIHSKPMDADDGGGATVYLVGTAHISKASCEDVSTAIRYLKPQAIFVELCKDRRHIVLQQEKFEVPSAKSLIDSWRAKNANAFGIFYSYFLAKVAEKMEVVPGAEFQRAYKEGMALKADVIFGDRPVQVTLQRTWRKMPFWSKVRLGYNLLTNMVFLPSVEELNKMLAETSDTDVVTLLIQEYGKQFPELIDTLVTERDLFMTYVLQNIARNYSTVVAVVGKGHVSGIISNWEKSIDLHPLMEVPEKKSSKMGWVLAACGVALGVVYWRHRVNT